MAGQNKDVCPVALSNACKVLTIGLALYGPIYKQVWPIDKKAMADNLIIL